MGADEPANDYNLLTSYISPGSMIAVSVAPTVLGIIAVSLRFHIRRGQSGGLSWDDWLLVPGLILTIGMAATVLVGVGLGSVGYDVGLPPGSPPSAMEFISNDRTLITQKIRPAVQIMQIVALGFIKASFVMFYRRVFCWGGRDWFWWASRACLGIVIAWTVAFLFASIFYCGTHFDAQWGSFNDQAVFCPDSLQVQFGLAVTDFATDVLIILLPIPAIMQLNMSVAKRLLVFAVFIMGALSVASSGVRMGIISVGFSHGLSLSVDRDKGAACIIFWSMLENGAAIVAACLPILRVLFRFGILSRLNKSSLASPPTVVDTEGQNPSSNKGRSRGRMDSEATEITRGRGRGRAPERGRGRQSAAKHGDTDVSHLDLNDYEEQEKGLASHQEDVQFDPRDAG